MRWRRRTSRDCWARRSCRSRRRCTPPRRSPRRDWCARSAPTRRCARCCRRRSWGYTPAAGYRANAIRYPNDDALIDELGHLTFRELDERTNRLANAWSDAGLVEGDAIGIMCRNHRYFIEATVAASKLGIHCLYLNTQFAGPQLEEVVKREKPVALVYDEEFSELLEDAAKRRKRFIAWYDPEATDGERTDPTLEELIEAADPEHAGAAGRVRARGDPHLGHDRHAEGRDAQAAGDDRAGRRAPVQDPAARAPAHVHRRAAVPLVGLRALHARDAAQLDAHPQAQVRPREHALDDRAVPGAERSDGAGDGAADHGPARGDAAQVRHLLAARPCRSAARRCRATWRSSS